MPFQEPMPKFDIIDDRFGEPLPAPPMTAMDIDERYDRTFFRAAAEDRDVELLRGDFPYSLFFLSALTCVITFSTTSRSTFGRCGSVCSTQ